MANFLTNPEWYREWNATYSACRVMGMEEDAQIMMHINMIYKKTDGRIREYLAAGSQKERVTEMAHRLGFISLNDANLLTYGHEGSEKKIMSDISIDAHCGKRGEDWSERLLRQKILLCIDSDYREEKIAEYESVVLLIANGGNGV